MRLNRTFSVGQASRLSLTSSGMNPSPRSLTAGSEVRDRRDACPTHASCRGSAVIMLLVLIAMLLVIITANNGSINSLRRDLRAIEREQQRHWQGFPGATNRPAASPLVTPAPEGAAHE